MDLLLLAVVVPIWLVAVVYAYLEIRDGIRLYRAHRQMRALIESLDLTEPQGRPRLGIRQEED